MKRINVAVTGAAGQIGYALIFRIASGEVFGKNTEIDLKLLELPVALASLKGVQMELEDGAFPNLRSITATASLSEAFKDCHWALLVGSAPRKAGMERNDLIKINGGIFTKQGQALQENCADDCKVLVVGNPCNTNCLIAMKNCPRLPAKNFFSMTMLDEKRAISQLAIKANVPSNKIRHMAIWGNHSSTQYPDFYNALIDEKNTLDVISDERWLQNEYIQSIQQRGSSIIKARGASSAASAANAAIETVKSLITPTPSGSWFSAAVVTTAAKQASQSYGIAEELVFGFPLISDGKDWKVVEGIQHNSFSKEKIQASKAELLNEKDLAKQFL